MSIMGVVNKVKNFSYDIFCYLYAVLAFTGMMVIFWIAGTALLVSLTFVILFNVKENIILTKALFEKRKPEEYV